MEAAIECTHCGVVMTSWSAPGSPIRYYQCPFCTRTHSSLYGEVFRRRAGARVLEGPAAPAAPTPSAGIPMPSPEDVRWNRVKASAARWFERLEADEKRHEPAVRATVTRVPIARPAAGAKAAAPAKATPSPAKTTAPAKATPAPAKAVAPGPRAVAKASLPGPRTVRHVGTAGDGDVPAAVPDADPRDVVEVRPAAAAAALARKP